MTFTIKQKNPCTLLKPIKFFSLALNRLELKSIPNTVNF